MLECAVGNCHCLVYSNSFLRLRIPASAGWVGRGREWWHRPSPSKGVVRGSPLACSVCLAVRLLTDCPGLPLRNPHVRYRLRSQWHGRRGGGSSPCGHRRGGGSYRFGLLNVETHAVVNVAVAKGSGCQIGAGGVFPLLSGANSQPTLYGLVLGPPKIIAPQQCQKISIFSTFCVIPCWAIPC